MDARSIDEDRSDDREGDRMRIFAGDVGGTNSRMAVFEVSGPKLEQLWSRTYSSKAHASLVEVVRSARDELSATLAGSGDRGEPAGARRSSASIDAASFGVAGPVKNGVCRATNLPWIVDSRELAQALDLPRAGLINDLEANAFGLGALGPSDLSTLREGEPNARGNAALISAGTGLGEAGLYWDGREHHPFACEGGHASFSPRATADDEAEIDLLRWLAERYGHVSWERVLSGPGLYNIYQFLRDTRRAPEPAEFAQRIASGDPGAAITQAALKEEFELPVRALTMFVKLYGAEAGNLALKLMSTGGVYIGGGIAPRIASWLGRPMFIESFLDKGRLRPILEAMPVHIVLNDRTALLGAARHAASTRDPSGRDQ
jgi:glucokinase